MKKFLIMAAVLAFAGIVHAANIPMAVDAKSGGPEVWVDQVYNASNSDFDVGDAVVWTIADSTGDNDNWVTTSTAANSTANMMFAGVVYPNAIASGDIGSIAIWGNGIAVDTNASVTAAGDEISLSSTAGSFGLSPVTDAGIYASLGFCTSTPASSSCVARIIGR